MHASVECLMLLLVCLFINLIVAIYTCTEVFLVKLKINLIAQWLYRLGEELLMSGK